MKNYQLVTAVHGNEYMPTLALASMGEEQVVANPKALSLSVRYTEHDLNAAFGTGGDSCEEKRAEELLKILDKKRQVVDFHTFSCESEPFAIVVDLSQLSLAMKLGVKHVVYMKHNIKGGHALINHRSGVSVEVGGHSDPQSFSLTQEIVENLKRDKAFSDVRVYEVFGRIEEQGNYKNFVNVGEFVPVLYGERAYPGQGFYGLMAREITNLRVAK